VFGNIALNPYEEISRWNNFQTFDNGLTLLFRRVFSLPGLSSVLPTPNKFSGRTSENIP
jgi:hypothetical protein